MSAYTIISTQPTVYQDPDQGVVNGVLIRFRLDDYDEVQEVRIPKLDAGLAQAAIKEVVDQRDALAKASAQSAK